MQDTAPKAHTLDHTCSSSSENVFDGLRRRFVVQMLRRISTNIRFLASTITAMRINVWLDSPESDTDWTHPWTGLHGVG